jgi:hypothetical protein
MSYLAVKLTIGTIQLEASGDREDVLRLHDQFVTTIKDSVAEVTRAAEVVAASKRGEVAH